MLNQRYGTIVAPIVTLVFLLLVWEVATLLATIPTFILPAPTEIAQTMFNNRAILWQNMWITIYEIFLGFLLSIVVGVTIAIIVSYSRILNRCLFPILVASQAVPKVAIAPLLIVWFGFGLTSKVGVAFLTAFFPIVITTAAGIQSTPADMIALVRSMGANSWQRFIRIVVPYSLPSFFSGLKVAITLAVIGAIIGEFVGANSGIGYIIMRANGQLDTPLLLGGIVILAAIGIILFYAIELLERICVPWRVKEHDEKASTM